MLKSLKPVSTPASSSAAMWWADTPLVGPCHSSKSTGSPDFANPSEVVVLLHGEPAELF